jgi:CHAD domain-containing protein
MKKDSRNLVIIQLQEYLQKIEYFQRLFLETKNDEALHQFRVHIRKSRTVLKAFEYLFPKKSFHKVYKHLSKIADSTNKVRDLDVFLVRKKVPKRLRKKAYNILRFERKKLAFFLCRDRTLRDLEHYKTFLEEAKKAPSIKVEPCKKRVVSYFQRIERYYGDYLVDKEKKKLHKVRITLKKIRYYLEAFNDSLCKSNYNFVMLESKYLQELLGQLNDVTNQQLLISRYIEQEKCEEDRLLQELLEKLQRKEVKLEKKIEPLLEGFSKAIG